MSASGETRNGAVQAEAVRGTSAELEMRLRIEAHQRILTKWEAKVAYQLEKILRLQQGGTGMYTPGSGASTAQLTPKAY